MGKSIPKSLFLKIIVSLLPAGIFTQNYAWMSLNKGAGIAFLILWILIILAVWKLEKYQSLFRLFRLAEIATFLLPISMLILIFRLGSEALTQTSEVAESVGAGIGVAFAGMVGLIVAFFIGLFGGIILHLIGNSFKRKIKKQIKK